MIVQASQPDAELSETDWIEFYGTGLDTPWTDTRVYWLVEGNQAGKRIPTINGLHPRTNGVASFLTTMELKPRTIYWAALQNGDEESFFGPVISSDADDELLQLNHLDTLASRDGQLEVALQGVSDSPHAVQVKVNGIEVGSLAFDGQSPASASFPLPPGLLRPGQNSLTLTAQNGEEDLSLLNYICVSYWHTMDADEDVLQITLPGNQAITARGFTSPAIRAFDVTDPLNVMQITGTVSRKASGYSFSARIPDSGTRILMLLADTQLQTPDAVGPNNPSAWNKKAPGADVVIISHPDFKENMTPLKAQLRAEGYSVALEDVDDLYDRFNYGEKTPYALKNFITNALKHWTNKPRFLLLVGDASFDPKNYLGLGDFDYVPTKLVDTGLLKTASDDWFADSDNEGIPEIPVGRISVRTPEEAVDQVAKIVAYKQGTGLTGDTSWTRKVVLVADSNDGFDFEAASDLLADQVPSSMSVTKIYRGQTDDSTARSLVLQRLNAGALLVNYFGHGSVELWRGDLLTSDDTAGLTNGTKLPLVIAMDCLNGFFDDIYTESLAEALMKAPHGGAVAVWASSGLSDAQNQQAMALELFRQLFNYRQTVGEAVLKAKASAQDPNVRRTWIFFGDPTLRLHF